MIPITALLLPMVAQTTSYGGYTFIPLPKTAEGMQLRPHSISADGIAIIGRAEGNFGAQFAPFLWTRTGGSKLLTGNNSVSPEAVSNHALSIYGSFDTGNGFVWSSSNGFQPFQASAHAYPSAVTPEGKFVTGFCNTTPQAFYWSSASGLQVVTGFERSVATGISNDGKWVTGTEWVADKPQTMLWNTGVSARGLGVPAGCVDSFGAGISGNGAVVFGIADDSAGYTQAYRWTGGSAFTLLGGLRQGVESSLACSNLDGSLMGGTSGNYACLWVKNLGWIALNTLLRSRAPSVAKTWQLATLKGMSQDGTVLFGDGRDGTGEAASWVLYLPPVIPTGDSFATPAGTTLTRTTAGGVLRNDINGSFATAAVATSPSHGTLSLQADGSFTYTPAAGYKGPDSFTYTATRGSYKSGATLVTLTIT